MMKSPTRRLGATASLLWLGTALGAFSQPLPERASRAQLVAALPAAREALIDGRFWHCAAASCTAAAQDGADSQPTWMECAHAAAVFGAFTEYQTGAETLIPAKLAHCNAKAKRS